MMKIDRFLEKFPTQPDLGVTDTEIAGFRYSVQRCFPVFWKTAELSAVNLLRLCNTYATAQRLPRKNLTPFACSLPIDDIALFRYFLNGDTEQWAVTFSTMEIIDMGKNLADSLYVTLPANPKDSDLADAIRELRAKIQEL